MVEIMEDISSKQNEVLKKNLLKSGLKLLDNKKSILIESPPFEREGIQFFPCRIFNEAGAGR